MTVPYNSFLRTSVEAVAEVYCKEVSVLCEMPLCRISPSVQ